MPTCTSDDDPAVFFHTYLITSDGFKQGRYHKTGDILSLEDEMKDFRRTYTVIPKDRINRMVHQKIRDFDAGTAVDRGPGIPFAYSNNPRPGQFDGRRLSRWKVADYKRFVVADGDGIRNSIYVSGCNFRCKNCFQPAIFDFNAGFDYNQDLEDQIIDDLKYDYVQGLTLLGGEPFANTPMLIQLCRRVRDVYGNDKTIWSWTGFTWEELHREGETPDKLELLSYVDILVDGRFMWNLKDPGLQFRGSSNQRVIDVQRSEDEGTVHIWDRLHDEKGRVPEISIKDRAKGEGTES
jgi:anaerobic ribonucleoside-triphosphate reductase activating protein